jgi:hypothetical protein
MAALAYSSKAAKLWYRMNQENTDMVAKREDLARRLTKDGFRFAVGIPRGHHSTVWSAD